VGPRGGAVMDLRTGKWKVASTPLFPPDRQTDGWWTDGI